MGSPRYGACAAAAQRRTAESIADLRQIVSRVNPTELRDKRLQRLQQHLATSQKMCNDCGLLSACHPRPKILCADDRNLRS